MRVDPISVSIPHAWFWLTVFELAGAVGRVLNATGSGSILLHCRYVHVFGVHSLVWRNTLVFCERTRGAWLVNGRSIFLYGLLGGDGYCVHYVYRTAAAWQENSSSYF